jgi:hypothetical protein
LSDGILYYYNHNSIITRYQQQQTNNRQATVFHPQLSAQIFIGSSVFKSLTALNAMRKCRAHMSYFSICCVGYNSRKKLFLLLFYVKIIIPSHHGWNKNCSIYFSASDTDTIITRRERSQKKTLYKWECVKKLCVVSIGPLWKKFN